MEQKQPQKAKLDVWTNLQSERSDAMQEQENADLSKKIQDILAHAPKEIDTPDGKFPHWQIRYNGVRQFLGCVWWHHEGQIGADKYCAGVVTDIEDVFDLPHYWDIIFLIREKETAHKFRLEGKRAAAAWERLKESYKVFCSLPALDSIKDADARAKAQAEQTALHEFYGDTYSMVLQAIHDDIEEYQRSLIAAHEADDDFLVRLANSVKICAAIIAGQATTTLHTIQDKHSGPKTFSMEHDVKDMDAKEKQNFYSRLLSYVQCYTFSNLNRRFLRDNHRTFGGMQIYLSYIEDKDKSLYKELIDWKNKLFKNSSWPCVQLAHVRTWKKNHPKEAETETHGKEESPSKDDAQPPEDELTEKALEFIKSSSPPEDAAKKMLSAGFNIDRVKARTEKQSHGTVVETLDAEVAEAFGDDGNGIGARIATYGAKHKRNNGTILIVDGRIFENVSTLRRQSPKIAKLFDYVVTKSIGRVIANGELFDELLYIPYSEFVRDGVYQTENGARKAIDKYKNALTSLKMYGEYKQRRGKGYDKLTLDGSDRLVVLFPSIGTENGALRVRFNPDAAWGLFTQYKYPAPEYFYTLPDNARIMLDTALATARKTSTSDSTRANKLKRDGILQISIRTLASSTTIPLAAETDHPDRKVIKPIIDALKDIKSAEERTGRHRFSLTLNSDADTKNAEEFEDGTVTLHLYGAFRQQMLLPAKEQEAQIKKDAQRRLKIDIGVAAKQRSRKSK